MKKNELTIEFKLGNLPFFIDHFYGNLHKSDAHKHEDYYELIFLSEGEGFHWIETEEYCIAAPEFYFLKPGQLHHWQFTAAPKGYIILFKKSYFDQLRDCNLMNLCRQLESKVRIDGPTDCSLEFLFEAMLHEFNSPLKFSETIIHGVLAALFAKMLQFAAEPHREQLKPFALFDKFMDLGH